MPRRRTRSNGRQQAENYKHPEAKSLLRPDVGTQAQFQKKKPPRTYRYDSSLSPALEWDGQNPAREQGEALIREILEAGSLEQAKAAAGQLKALGQPFLNWAGKAERLSFDVPTLPLFNHERLSTKAIIETLKSHRKGSEQPTLFDLFGDPEHPIADQVLRAYEHSEQWSNRMILGDNLAVMNSLLRFENLGGQVQMIYMDPPYGVRFGSNFQPFVRKRDVKHNDDDDLSREPEMVRAYRDTWELGLHSYLTYLRDRLLVCRELLHNSGSIFVQISDENLHHVRELMDEVFGAENFCSVITYRTSVPLTSAGLAGVTDYLLWYARDKAQYKYRDLFIARETGEKSRYLNVELPAGHRRALTAEEKGNLDLLPTGSRVFADMDLASSGYTPSCIFDFEYKGRTYRTSSGKSWKTTKEGMQRLARAGRIFDSGKTIRYVIYLDDFPVTKLSNSWQDTTGELDKHYVVQTHTKVLQRCLLMTTDPGDLVLDPTCGGGTTAYVGEQWGRRWITIDVSRVPLALARQRLLTATFPWYELKDEQRGPVGGFEYKRKQNNKGEEVGGVVPHLTLRSIAHDEPPAEEVLVDRPEVTGKITRVTGAFTVEGTIPPPAGWEQNGNGKHNGATASNGDADFATRMLEILRKSPVLRLEGNKSVTFQNVRPPAKSLWLSAEAMVKNGTDKPVGFVFGPENGAVAEILVQEALREAYLKGYAHLYVIGFSIQPHARLLIENSCAMGSVPATYVQATPDLLMGDLLKNMRSSQIFSVCGLPEIEVRRMKGNGKSRNGATKYQVSLLGLDVFDPVTMEAIHRKGDDVPVWMLDTDYNGLCFHVSQAFFPRTSAWDHLKKALKSTYRESVWDHLAGTTSAPFDAGKHRSISVKVIDDRGNELQVVKSLDDVR